MTVRLKYLVSPSAYADAFTSFFLFSSLFCWESRFEAQPRVVHFTSYSQSAFQPAMSFNQYGGPPGHDQAYYGGGGPGYGGQHGNYPPPQQYGGQPQQGYYPPQVNSTHHSPFPALIRASSLRHMLT